MKRISLIRSLALPLGAAFALNAALLIRELIANWGSGDLGVLYYKVIDGYVLVGLPLSLLFVAIAGVAAFAIRRPSDEMGAAVQLPILACLYLLFGLGLAVGARFPVTQDWLLLVVPLLIALGLAHGLLALLGSRMLNSQ